MPEALAWPPRREDLERLYVAEHLSAMKIAEAYGLEYANPKTAESTVLYHLKRNGIQRRDPAEHIYRVTEVMVDEWVARYKAGESLKRISGGEFTPATVWNHLKRREVPLRDKVQAQIKAVTKYERKPFRENGRAKAYLMGLRFGDLDAVTHGRAVRIRLSTTHPAMARLFEELFEEYGKVKWYPRRNPLVGYEWTLECDLDGSFSFLLPKAIPADLQALGREEMRGFLAGLFDAEGSIYLHNKRGRRYPEASFTNAHQPLIDFVSRTISGCGLGPKQEWRDQALSRGGVGGRGRLGHVRLWRVGEVQDFLRTLPLRHDEKVEKARLVLDFKPRLSGTDYEEFVRRWEELLARIRLGRNTFVAEARRVLETRGDRPGIQPF